MSIFFTPNTAFRLALVLFMCSGSLIAAAQSPLKIPQSPEEYRALTKDRDGKPCTTCGVVASLRTRSASSSGSAGGSNLGANPAMDGGPGGDLATVPIGKGAGKPPKPAVIHVISVKYDNGSYGLVEQSDEPRLKMGQRVRVTDGRVEPE